MKIPPAQRPTTQDYGIATSGEGLIAWEWVRGQITQSRNYWICSTRPDGRPHAAPVWGVALDDVIYFGSAKTSVKRRNLSHNPQIALHLESGDDCVIIEGTVFDVDDETLLERIAADYSQKYAPYSPTAEELRGITYGVMPGVVMAWQEHDFPNTATKWIFK